MKIPHDWRGGGFVVCPQCGNLAYVSLALRFSNHYKKGQRCSLSEKPVDFDKMPDLQFP